MDKRKEADFLDDVEGEYQENEALQDEVSQDEGLKEEKIEDKSNDSDKLVEELNEIRDMFQNAIDENQDVYDNTSVDFAEVIQELDEIPQEVSEEEIDETMLCENCHKNPKSTLYEEDYPFCDECIELLAGKKKYPILATGILSIILVFCSIFFVNYINVGNIENFTLFVDISKDVNNAMIFDAAEKYNTYVSAQSQMGEEAVYPNKLNKNLINMYAENGYYQDATAMIQALYSETELKMPWNKGLVDIVDMNETLNTTYSAISTVLGDITQGSTDFDLDEKLAELDKLLEDETNNKVFVEYYKYVVMTIAGESKEDQLKQLELVDEADDGTLEWIFINNLCDISAKLGDEAAAQEYFDRSVKSNAQSGSAYIALSSYYRFLDEPNADKMIEIATLGMEKASENDHTLDATLAAAYLLKDDAEKAKEVLEPMMEQQAYTVQGCNLYALCSIITKDDSGYDEAKAIMDQYGNGLSELVTQFKDGKIELSEVLADQGGEL